MPLHFKGLTIWWRCDSVLWSYALTAGQKLILILFYHYYHYYYYIMLLLLYHV